MTHRRRVHWLQTCLAVCTILACGLLPQQVQAQRSQPSPSYRLHTNHTASFFSNPDIEELGSIRSLQSTATSLYVTGALMTAVGVASAIIYVTESPSNNGSGLAGGFSNLPLTLFTGLGMITGGVGLVLLIAGAICDGQATHREAQLRRRRRGLNLSFDVTPLEGGAMANATLRF